MHSTPRFFVPSIALLLAAGGISAEAQQRTEVIVRRSARSEPTDSVERQLRPLQRQLDSLTRLYSESDQLTSAERRKLVEDLARMIDRITVTNGRGAGELRVRVPGVSERGETMARSMFNVQSASILAMPKGWLGFVAVGAGIPTRFEQGEFIVRYMSYPRIVSVDPSSPAQRAGIIPDDTLLAYNGLDVRENDISLTRLLQPNAKVNVRVKRDGRVRDIPVIVAEAPQRIVQRRDDEVRDTHDTWAVAGVPSAPAFPRQPVGVSIVRTPRPPQGAVAATAPGAPQVSAMGAMRPTMLISMASGVAGAQMAALTEGLARVVGVSSGVLVTVVPVGSPANESGLLDGDVIVRVSGRTVRNVTEVRELVGIASQNGDREVELDILRDKRAQKVILRW